MADANCTPLSEVNRLTHPEKKAAAHLCREGFLFLPCNN